MLTLEFTHRFILITIVLIFGFKIDQSTGICTRAPTIVGYSRQHGSPTMSYNIMWKSAACQDGGIVRYQIQFTESCSSTPFNWFVNSNSISTQINCTGQDCYIRIRAELLDGSFSDFSTCVLINNQVIENERVIEQHYQGLCVPIEVDCGPGSLPNFYINGRSTLWPEPDDRHFNTSYSEALSSYNFCFNNITEDTILTEYCFRGHTSGCSLCPIESGEIRFLSYSDIHVSVHVPRNKAALTSKMSTLAYTYTSALTKSYVKYSMSHLLIEEVLYTTTTTSLERKMTHHYDNEEIELSQSTLLGAIGIGASCLLIGLALSAIAIALLCHKFKNNKESDTVTCLQKQRSSNEGHIYDELSTPNPIYQEVSAARTDIQMMGNESYVTLRDANTVTLHRCPAYARHQDLHS